MGVEHASTEADPRSVTVLGAYATPVVPADPRSIAEIVLEAVEGALADTGLGWTDIDSVVTASVDLLDGLTASNIAITEVVGAVHKPETRIAADGLAAAIHASHQIRAEAYGTVLVVAHGKASMGRYWDLSAWAMDPIFLQPLGVDFLTCAGLQAGRLARSRPHAAEEWAQLVAARRAAAGVDSLTADQVLASPMLAAPIRAAMAAPLGDGACAVVLGSQVPTPGDVVIAGTGHDVDVHHPGSRDLTTWAGLRRACDRAYAEAGIVDPETAFDLVEPSCFFPHEETLVRDAARVGADADLSPSGGLFGGTAPVIAGLTRLIAAARAIKGHPGRRALTHGTWGPAGQGQAVAVLEAQ